MDRAQTKNKVLQFNEGMDQASKSSEIIPHVKVLQMSLLICECHKVRVDLEFTVCIVKSGSKREGLFNQL